MRASLGQCNCRVLNRILTVVCRLLNQGFTGLTCQVASTPATTNKTTTATTSNKTTVSNATTTATNDTLPSTDVNSTVLPTTPLSSVNSSLGGLGGSATAGASSGNNTGKLTVWQIVLIVVGGVLTTGLIISWAASALSRGILGKDKAGATHFGNGLVPIDRDTVRLAPSHSAPAPVVQQPIYYANRYGPRNGQV